jgi:hypothetical protein
MHIPQMTVGIQKMQRKSEKLGRTNKNNIQTNIGHIIKSKIKTERKQRPLVNKIQKEPPTDETTYEKRKMKDLLSAMRYNKQISTTCKGSPLLSQRI